MATKDEALPLELKHLETFSEFIFPEYGCFETCMNLAKAGLLQVSTAFEHAIAKANGNIMVESGIGKDFSDGSDAKLSSVRTCSYGKTYSAPVSSVHTKTGTLRVQVYERKQDKFYYFSIPYHAYKHIPKTSNIEIPFKMDGTPSREPGRRRVNYWDYEVSSFEEMSL